MFRNNVDTASTPSPASGIEAPPGVPAKSKEKSSDKAESTSAGGNQTSSGVFPEMSSDVSIEVNRLPEEHRERMLPETKGRVENVQRARLISSVAAKAHDEWREPRKIPGTGEYEPRWKPVRDKDWIEQNHGTPSLRMQDGRCEVNIAGLAHKDLPPEHRKENDASAAIAVDAILRACRNGVPLDESFIEKAAEEEHTAWLERNGSWASEIQKKPYAELPESEKEKDRRFISEAIEIFRQDSMER